MVTKEYAKFILDWFNIDIYKDRERYEFLVEQIIMAMNPKPYDVSLNNPEYNLLSLICNVISQRRFNEMVKSAKLQLEKITVTPNFKDAYCNDKDPYYVYKEIVSIAIARTDRIEHSTQNLKKMKKPDEKKIHEMRLSIDIEKQISRWIQYYLKRELINTELFRKMINKKEEFEQPPNTSYTCEKCGHPNFRDETDLIYYRCKKCKEFVSSEDAELHFNYTCKKRKHQRFRDETDLIYYRCKKCKEFVLSENKVQLKNNEDKKNKEDI